MNTNEIEKAVREFNNHDKYGCVDYSTSPYYFGDKYLYNLCEDHPDHNCPDITITKILFIGHIYSAPLERRKIKPKDVSNDIFYIEDIIKLFINYKSNIDTIFDTLTDINKKYINKNCIQYDDIEQILKNYNTLVSIFAQLVLQNQQSFVSKYLHFHFPALFFLLDSRSEKNIKKYVKEPSEKYKDKILPNNQGDDRYAKFYCCCHELQNKLQNALNNDPEVDIVITPRILDNFLLDLFAWQENQKRSFSENKMSVFVRKV